MQLYTTLMMLLLAFFIVLQTMTQDQASGFSNGIGKVKDAFGSMGGLGLLSYDMFRNPNAAIPVEKKHHVEDGSYGLHKAMLEGAGGGGNTEAEPAILSSPEYVRVHIPASFRTGSHAISREIAEYLDVTGTGFAMFDVHFVLRSYCTESSSPKDRELALRRALSIVRYLHRRCGVPYDRMQAAGYDAPRYFVVSAEDNPALPTASQGTYFYIYRNRPSGEAGIPADDPRT
jgi:hypothetical protein